jgi:UDP-N-acetylglucosamine 4,6-dehydratase
MKMNWSEQVVMVTGGTGSFGRRFIEIMLQEYGPRTLIVFSRDELKQFEMRSAGLDHPCLQYFVGDVRDSRRLEQAMSGVTLVVHAAALKQVPVCEDNPFEAVQTNIVGSKNVIAAALNRRVRRVIALSTDKAVNPISVYGATKLCAERMFVNANRSEAGQETRFSCVRSGNFLASRSSVIPTFLEQKKQGKITITDARMTRFWITLDHAAQFVIRTFERMEGGEVFVPKAPSMRLLDMAQAVAPNCRIEWLGKRPGEKLHEVLVSAEEARYTVEADDRFVIRPPHAWRNKEETKGIPVAEGFSYASDTNQDWLTAEDLRQCIGMQRGVESILPKTIATRSIV